LVRPIVLFDGECGFCNRVVSFILEREREPCLRFASLQSETGRALLRHSGLPDDDLGSIVLVDGARALTRSTAVLEIARYLRPPWSLLPVLLMIPPLVRDTVYALVARNRHRLPGRGSACVLASDESRVRILT
jgi:predicted DCC family thiol-disulfide oxidoreductase YuxK